MNRLAERFEILVPLRHRPYRILFSGQVISNIGDWLDILALITLIIYRWDLGAGAWGGVLTALTLPYALLGPFAGVWVDRWNQRAVMVTCDLARAVLALGLVWASNLTSVLLLVTASSVFSTFFLPAQQSMIRRTVPEDDLLAANALGQLSENGARLVGPALGGLIVVLGGAKLAFVVNALTFLLSAAILSRLPIHSPPIPLLGRASRSFRAELRDGFRHIVRNRTLLITVGATVMAAFLIRGTDTLSAIVLKLLGVTEGMQGISATALGLGYVAGALLAGQWGQRFDILGILGSGTVLVGAVLALIGLFAAFEITGVGSVVLAAFVGRALLGVGYAVTLVAYGSVLQQETPDELMGRVTATSRSLVAGVPLASPLVGTLLADWWGIGVAYAALGAGLVLIGVAVVAGGRAQLSENDT